MWVALVLLYRVVILASGQVRINSVAVRLLLWQAEGARPAQRRVKRRRAIGHRYRKGSLTSVLVAPLLITFYRIPTPDLFIPQRRAKSIYLRERPKTSLALSARAR